MVGYYICAGVIYACICTILILVLVFGLRAKKYVTKKITSLSEGFSPLDVQRIFIGKTYPRRLTSALIVHWAQLGYLQVKYIDKTRVQLIKIKDMPTHDDEKAVFYDRGTYVRERDLFNLVFTKQEKEVDINRSMFTKSEIKSINTRYAVREDEGIFSPKHYKLKVFTFILSILPFIVASVYLYTVQASEFGVISPFFTFMGMFVFSFAPGPFWFLLLWSSPLMIGGTVTLIVLYQGIPDPYGICYAAVAILFIGTFLLTRLVDYREKNNFSDYSDLVNYRKFLLFGKKTELVAVDYYSVLPFLYAFKIKSLVKRKYNTSELPVWYLNDDGQRGKLV